jgi:hypothetical protein
VVSDLFTRSLPKRQFQGGDHLTCKNILNANIAISVATNKPVPKKRIFITIDTRLGYKAFFKRKKTVLYLRVKVAQLNSR